MGTTTAPSFATLRRSFPNQVSQVAGVSPRIHKVIFGLAPNIPSALTAYPFAAMARKKAFPKPKWVTPSARTIPVRSGSDDLGHGDRLWYYADDAFHSVEVELGGWLRRIQCDREGRMWFCTLEEALYLDGDGFSSFSPADGLPHPTVKAVFQDRKHHFWFATWGGVGRYDDSISVSEPELEMSRFKCEISQLVQDRRGGVWVGYSSPLLNNLEKSVVRFNGEYFAHIGAEDGLDIDKGFARWHPDDGLKYYGLDDGLIDTNSKACCWTAPEICGPPPRRGFAVSTAAPSTPLQPKTGCRATTSDACSRIVKATSGSVRTAVWFATMAGSSRVSSHDTSDRSAGSSKTATVGSGSARCRVPSSATA